MISRSGLRSRKPTLVTRDTHNVQRYIQPICKRYEVSESNGDMNTFETMISIVIGSSANRENFNLMS